MGGIVMYVYTCVYTCVYYYNVVICVCTLCRCILERMYIQFSV